MSDQKVLQLFLFVFKYQLSPCCENWSIAEQGLFCIGMILREKIAAVKSKALAWSRCSVFLLSSLKLFMLDHEQPTSSPAFPAAGTLQWDDNPAFAITMFSHVVWFYKSNIVLSLQEQQQQQDRLQIAMLAEVSKYLIVWQCWTNSKLIFTL